MSSGAESGDDSSGIESPGPIQYVNASNAASTASAAVAQLEMHQSKMQLPSATTTTTASTTKPGNNARIAAEVQNLTRPSSTQHQQPAQTHASKSMSIQQLQQQSQHQQAQQTPTSSASSSSLSAASTATHQQQQHHHHQHHQLLQHQQQQQHQHHHSTTDGEAAQSKVSHGAANAMPPGGSVMYPAAALANVPQDVLLSLVQAGHLQVHQEEGKCHRKPKIFAMHISGFIFKI